MIPGADPIPDDVAALRAALVAEQLARREAEARASGAEAMVAHLKLMTSVVASSHGPDLRSLSLNLSAILSDMLMSLSLMNAL